MSPTLGRVLGGESVKAYERYIIGIMMMSKGILVYDKFINHLANGI